MLAVTEILVKAAVMITGTKIISLGGQAPSLLSNVKPSVRRLGCIFHFKPKSTTCTV